MCSARRRDRRAQGRIVSVDEVAKASPDLIIGSWCGKKFVPGRVTSRPGLETVAAVQNKAVYEIRSPIHPAARSSGTDIITGASGTTDIEGILVRGAHGPRNLHIVIAT